MSEPVETPQVEKEAETENEYVEYANRLKEQGNAAFQAGDLKESIRLYSQGLEMDPDNHVLYSNRSAGRRRKDVFGS